MIQCNEITQTVNELAPHMHSLDLYNSSVAGGSSIETFDSTNLWSVNFRDNYFNSGNIDPTKADLTQGNNVSSINFIGNNVIETLTAHTDRASALLAGLPLYSAYLKTSGVAYPTTTGWVRDIVLPS